MKRATGWLLFVVGILYILTNLVWVGMEASGVLGYMPNWDMLPFQLILWLAITAALTIGGWKLAHSSKRDVV